MLPFWLPLFSCVIRGSPWYNFILLGNPIIVFIIDIIIFHDLRNPDLTPTIILAIRLTKPFHKKSRVRFHFDSFAVERDPLRSPSLRYV